MNRRVSFRVRVDASRAGSVGGEARSVLVREGTMLFAAARRAGLPLAGSCRGGALCARCGLRIHRGAAAPEGAEEAEAKRRNRVDPELRLACCVRVESDLEVTADYW